MSSRIISCWKTYWISVCLWEVNPFIHLLKFALTQPMSSLTFPGISPTFLRGKEQEVVLVFTS